VNISCWQAKAWLRGFYQSVPLALWLFGPIWMLAGSLIVISVLYRLDREA